MNVFVCAISWIRLWFTERKTSSKLSTKIFVKKIIATRREKFRSFHDKKWSLFKRWKSRPRIIVVDGKAPKLKNCWNPSASAFCHAQSINFSSDFYLANYECGFLFDFSSFDFPCAALLVEVEDAEENVLYVVPSSELRLPELCFSGNLSGIFQGWKKL